MRDFSAHSAREGEARLALPVEGATQAPLKEMSAKTQIAFITHNRITMESSNTIYGVTMEEEGISKIISVRL